jgi:bacterioferritin-associated ferredoxin
MALVCLCHGVNERRVRREIEHGAATIEEVAAGCLAGSCCHGCHATIDALLEEHEQAVAAVAAPRRRRGYRFAS